MRFNARKTKSDGEGDNVHGQIDVSCGKRCVDTLGVCSAFLCLGLYYSHSIGKYTVCHAFTLVAAV